MSGDDILYWVGEIWYDVTNLATADIPSLLFRLFVLFAAIVIAQKIIRIVLRICRDVLQPVAQLICDILKGIWWVVFAPVRVPLGWLCKLRQAKEDRARQRHWEMQRRQDEIQRQEKEQQKQDEIAAEARAQEAELLRIKGMMNRLE